MDSVLFGEVDLPVIIPKEITESQKANVEKKKKSKSKERKERQASQDAADAVAAAASTFNLTSILD